MRSKSDQKVIDGMRDLLNFLEEHVEVTMPWFGSVNAFGNTADVAATARAMKPCKKDISSGYFVIQRAFGPVNFEVNFNREEVCTKVVVGEEEIPEKVIAAHTKEIVEWECPESIMNDEVTV